MKLITKTQNLVAGLAVTTLLTSLGTLNVAHANAVDDAANACIEAARLITEDDDLDAAIEEATWCLTGLNQLKDEIKLSLFPDELEGFQGGEIKNENIMGMATVSREYTQDGDTLAVSLITSGGAGAGALGGLGGLAELGKLFGTLDVENAGGAKKIRIQRRTVLVSDNGGTGSLSVELKSGGSLKVESQDLDSDELIDFMREFPIAEIDDATAQ